MKKAIVKYSPKLPKLTANQQKVLDLLCEAGELIAPIYELQENDKFPGANFYPHDVSKEEIEKAAKKDPSILSPYTVIERKQGKLIAIPYHEKYAELLKPISDKLSEASKLIDNKEFGKRLTIQAQCLLNGDYDSAMVAWLTTKQYVLNINIGPMERYNDKLFFVKTSYQAWVSVMDAKNTKTALVYKDMILSARRKALMPSEKVDYYDKVNVRVDDLVLYSGLVARTMFVGINLPNDTHLIEKYGSTITLFKQTNKIRSDLNLVVFNKLFDPKFREQFTEEDMQIGVMYSTALHEMAHTYLRYHRSEARLKDLFPVIDELSATVMGIKVCGSLLLKDVVSQKQLESIMLAYLIRSFHNTNNEPNNKSKYHYTQGGIIFINYLIESGALKTANGISWPNFMKMFVSLDQLASMLERIMSIGERKDAEDFIKKYGNIEKLRKPK